MFNLVHVFIFISECDRAIHGEIVYLSSSELHHIQSSIGQSTTTAATTSTAATTDPAATTSASASTNKTHSDQHNICSKSHHSDYQSKLYICKVSILVNFYDVYSNI